MFRLIIAFLLCVSPAHAWIRHGYTDIPANVLVVAGQSNATGLDNAGPNCAGLPAHLVQIDQKIQLWNGSAFVPLQNCANNNILTGGGFGGAQAWGPEAEFAYQWRLSHPSQTLYIVKYALGGSSLAVSWNPSQPALFYAALRDAITAALATISTKSPKVMGTLWMQGETDATDPTQAAAYQTNLTSLTTSAVTDWAKGNASAPFIIGRISDDSSAANRANVRTGERLVSAGSPTLIPIVNTDAYSRSGIHYDASGQTSLGGDMYKAFIGNYTFTCTGTGC